MTLPKKGRGGGGGGGDWATRHAGALSGLIIVVILIIVIVVIVAWFNSLFEAQNRLIEAGCRPAAFNQFGLVVAYHNC